MARNLLAASLFACLALALARPEIDVRIAGGYEARPNQFPYQVAIYIGSEAVAEPSIDNFCSGSLISPKYILTAAHCLTGAETVTIVIGSQQLDEPDADRVVAVATNFIIPENYVSGTYDWDIALIKLDVSVELSDNIKTVELAEGDDEYAGDIATVAGWGATYAAQYTLESALRWIESVIISYNQCTKDNPWFRQIVVRGSNFCQLTGAKSACGGDDGAPLVLDGVQIGVAASIPYNCLKGYPVVYTRVAQHIDWIRENSDI